MTFEKIRTKIKIERLFVFQGNQVCKRVEDEENNEEQLSPFISQRDNVINEFDDKGMGSAKLNYKSNPIFNKTNVIFLALVLDLLKVLFTSVILDLITP